MNFSHLKGSKKGGINTHTTSWQLSYIFRTINLNKTFKLTKKQNAVMQVPQDVPGRSQT